MHNQLILIGTAKDKPELITNENGKYIELIVNVRDEIEQNDITVTVFNELAEMVIDYVKKGTYLGVCGRLKETDKGLIVIAEKITFMPNEEE